MEYSFKNFKPLPDSDYDYQKYERNFSGRMTKARWKKLTRFARIFSNTHIYGTSPNGYAYRCGHEHDCCGCLCGQSMNVDYKHNQVKIFLSLSYNY